MSEYSKFIVPPVKRVKYGNGPDALPKHSSLAEHGPATDDIQYLDVTDDHGEIAGPNMGAGPQVQDSMFFTAPREEPSIDSKDVDPLKIADMEEKQALQKMLAKESNNHISEGLLSVGTMLGLLSLGTMLGVRLRRRVQPVTIPGSPKEMRSRDSHISYNISSATLEPPPTEGPGKQTGSGSTATDMPVGLGESLAPPADPENVELTTIESVVDDMLQGGSSDEDLTLDKIIQGASSDEGLGTIESVVDDMLQGSSDEDLTLEKILQGATPSDEDADEDLTLDKILQGASSEEELDTIESVVDEMLDLPSDEPTMGASDEYLQTLQGDSSDEDLPVYESIVEIAEATTTIDELDEVPTWNVKEVPEVPLPELEQEILVADEDLLREVDQDSRLWKKIEGLPVVSDPVLASVAPKVAAELDEDAITGRKVRMRALPLFVVWLAAPTLSLIDTAVVGRFAKGATAAAALAPAVSFSDSLAYLMTFLAIKSTSRVATFVSNYDGRGARLATREGLYLSAAMGLTMAIWGEFGGAAATLNKVYITGRTASVLGPATTYCRIRGACMPLQLCWQTAQAASIARGDSASPVKACAWAALFNVVGDIVLVAGLGLGVAGAALATALSMVVGCFTQVRALRKLENAERLAEAVYADDELNPMGCDRALEKEQIPTPKALIRLFLDSLPIFATLLSKTVVSVVLVAAAAGASLAELASHQIALGLFLLLAPFADALSAAAQSLAPRALRRAKQRPRKVLSTVLRETSVASVVACCLTWSLATFGGQLFSTNPFVHSTLASLGPWIGATLGVYIFNTVFEGILFAFGHAKPIGVLMPLNAVAVAVILLSKGVRGTPEMCLIRSWMVYFVYQVCRVPQLALIARLFPFTAPVS
jgi:Na+-driven multidrug efflux pump